MRQRQPNSLAGEWGEASDPPQLRTEGTDVPMVIMLKVHHTRERTRDALIRKDRCCLGEYITKPENITSPESKAHS